jgi:hypothetical protein
VCPDIYCQEDGGWPVFEDEWRGVRRVRMPVSTAGAAGTMVFDWTSTLHAAERHTDHEPVAGWARQPGMSWIATALRASR